MSDNGALNLAWSAALTSGLVAAGIGRVVLSPGSRSTPLALACLRHPALDCTVVLDERSAAWLALGMAKGEGRAVALLCTSGTAVANWLPATVEANMAGVPLLLLSADRPPELQACGANQTIDQPGLLAAQVRAFHAPGAPFAGFDARWLQQLVVRAVHQARWPQPGPVHINLAFREPLLPDNPQLQFAAPALAPPTLPVSQPDPAAVADLAARLQTPRGAIVCGELDADAALAEAIVALAERLNCPILAEPLSGLRFGAHDKSRLCTRYDHWLRASAWQGAAPDPAWVLRFGAFPVTRVLQQFVARAGAHYLVEAGPQWRDPLHRTDRLLQADSAAACAALLDALPRRAGADAWGAACRAADASIEALLADAELPAEARLMARLGDTLPAGTRLFCGNSMPIRDLDAFAGSGTNALRILANRGASGIDGNIASAAGIAVAGPTLAVLGDLSAQHDVGSLALLHDRPLVVIVINNGGGGIFDFLPQAALPEFERGWLTPQRFELGAAARAFSVAYVRTDSVDDALRDAAAALNNRQALLIELAVHRGAGLVLRQRWKERVSRAVSACSP